MIIAVLGAIAATRRSRMAGDADRTATAATVRELQKAIDCYHGEHGAHPTAADLGPQLTRFTDPAGTVLLWKADAATAKWVYDPTTGDVRPGAGR